MKYELCPQLSGQSFRFLLREDILIDLLQQLSKYACSSEVCIFIKILKTSRLARAS